VAIFHSYDYSWENFYQAKRRIYRKGQTKPVTYLVNVAQSTVDEVILETVFKKERESNAVVDEHVLKTIQRRAACKRR
jgi:SNF2 family DNA or RNA helicase